jgi:exopolysaccharide production protein ExoQ
VTLFQKLPEQIFAVLALFFYTGGIMPFISSAHPLAPLTLILPHLATVVTLLLLSLRWQKTITTIIRAPLFWLLMAIVVISPFWSEVPGQTWEEIAPLLRVTLFGLYLASRYSLKEMFQIIGWALFMAALLSFMFGAFLPSYGVMGRGYIGQSQDWTHEGSWRGIYVHKVVLGTVMTMSVLVSLYLASWKNLLRPLALAAIPFAVIGLLMSTTKAALLVLIIVLCCIPLYRSFRWRSQRLALFWGIGLPLISALVSVVLGNTGRILQALGKTTTLSGRTDIWPLVIENISQQPWFGYGYRSFWLNGWEGPAANVWAYLPFGFEPPHAHNGFLEILLSIGIVGFGIFVLNVIIFGLQAFRWARAHPTAEGLVPMLFLTLMLFINITETMWMTADVFWLCFVSMLLVIAQKPQTQVHYELYAIDPNWENLPLANSADTPAPAYFYK